MHLGPGRLRAIIAGTPTAGISANDTLTCGDFPDHDDGPDTPVTRAVTASPA
jgi:hypothetical protein